MNTVFISASDRDPGTGKVSWCNAIGEVRASSRQPEYFHNFTREGFDGNNPLKVSILPLLFKICR
jgi:hypothetical protein